MIVTVCGLHGGAGTTTVALLLAQAAALRAPGRVLLCDSAPAAGDLAIAVGQASSHNLTELARLVAAGRHPQQAPWIDLPGGLRLLALAPGARLSVPAEALAPVLTDADRAHDLVVLDAGAVTDEHAIGALQAADVVIWTLDATAQLGRCSQLLASDLSVPGRDARWLLAASATGRDGQPLVATQLAELVPSASRLILVAPVATQGAEDLGRQLAGGDLLGALT